MNNDWVYSDWYKWWLLNAIEHNKGNYDPNTYGRIEVVNNTLVYKRKDEI